MRIPFTLIDDTGHPVENPQNIVIRLSKNGGMFVPVVCNIHPIGLGCYTIELTDDQLRSQQGTLIHISADDCQPTLLEYTADDNSDAIAKAVWQADTRTLTSLSVGSKSASAFVARSKVASPKPSLQSGVVAQQILNGK